jgi:hypothetical protein
MRKSTETGRLCTIPYLEVSMSKNRYPSPRPWVIDHDIKVGLNLGDIIIRDAEGHLVAQVFQGRKKGNEKLPTRDEKACANAQLIVDRVNAGHPSCYHDVSEFYKEEEAE